MLDLFALFNTLYIMKKDLNERYLEAEKVVWESWSIAKSIKRLIWIPRCFFVIGVHGVFACECLHFARYVRSNYPVDFLKLFFLRRKHSMPCVPISINLHALKVR